MGIIAKRNRRTVCYFYQNYKRIQEYCIQGLVVDILLWKWKLYILYCTKSVTHPKSFLKPSHRFIKHFTLPGNHRDREFYCGAIRAFDINGGLIALQILIQDEACLIFKQSSAYWSGYGRDLQCCMPSYFFSALRPLVLSYLHCVLCIGQGSYVWLPWRYILGSCCSSTVFINAVVWWADSVLTNQEYKCGLHYMMYTVTCQPTEVLKALYLFTEFFLVWQSDHI